MLFYIFFVGIIISSFGVFVSHSIFLPPQSFKINSITCNQSGSQFLYYNNSVFCNLSNSKFTKNNLTIIQKDYEGRKYYTNLSENDTFRFKNDGVYEISLLSGSKNLGFVQVDVMDSKEFKNDKLNFMTSVFVILAIVVFSIPTLMKVIYDLTKDDGNEQNNDDNKDDE